LPQTIGLVVCALVEGGFVQGPSKVMPAIVSPVHGGLNLALGLWFDLASIRIIFSLSFENSMNLSGRALY